MKELLKPRNEQIWEAAKNGDGEAALLLANICYKGIRTKRSIGLARYWCFRAIELGNKRAIHFYKLIASPHFTSNEEFIEYGKRYNFSLSHSLLVSSTFKGKLDVLASDQKYYRTYHILRLLLLYFPLGAYRVYEVDNDSYRIFGKERSRFKEYSKWLLIDLAILAGIAFMILANY